MSAENDGGPAFPQPCATADGAIYTSGEKSNANIGMSLRDWFAGQALQGMLANHEYNLTDEALAVRAYSKASAMLAARERKA